MLKIVSEKTAMIENSEADLEEVEEESDKFSKEKLSAAELRNPQGMVALQARLDSLVGDPSGYIKTLPAAVQRRIKALKNLQLETAKVEAEFFKEVHALECKYQSRFQPYFEKRSQIAAGLYEPTDEECTWTLDDDSKEGGESNEDINSNAIFQDEKKDEDSKGVPEFWLTIFKNVELLADMIQVHDEPILKHLTDIKVRYLEDPMGFALDFFFSPNEYFENSVLTKTYDMKCQPEEEDPFSFKGPEIHKCKGTPIDWKKGKNTTVKTITKKQKHKSSGSIRTVSKTAHNDSFFHFFSPPIVSDGPDASVDESIQALLTADFEIGHYIRENIVPRATLFFTGDALMKDDIDEEEEEEEDDEAFSNPAAAGPVAGVEQSKEAKLKALLQAGCVTDPRWKLQSAQEVKKDAQKHPEGATAEMFDEGMKRYNQILEERKKEIAPKLQKRKEAFDKMMKEREMKERLNRPDGGDMKEEEVE